MTTKDQNLGNQVKLLGSNPGDTRKLIRVSEIAKEDITHKPWLVTVSCSIVSTVVAAFGTPVAKGTFGSGGVSHEIVFDVKPDSLLALPGTSVDLDVYWDDIFTQAATGTPPKAVPTRPTAAMLPTSATIKASTKQGSPTIQNATRSMFFSGTGATGWLFEIPKFSQSMMVYLPVEAEYATAGNEINFFTDENGFFPIIKYTGAQLKAIKDAGNFVPIPGAASHMTMFTPNIANPRAMFNLNL